MEIGYDYYSTLAKKDLDKFLTLLGPAQLLKVDFEL
jgi:hypothetical protein